MTHRAGSEPASNPHLCHCGAATPRLFRFSIGASSLGSPWNLSVSADAQELLELRAMSQTDAIHHYCGSTHGQQAHVWHPVASDTSRPRLRCGIATWPGILVWVREPHLARPSSRWMAVIGCWRMELSDRGETETLPPRSRLVEIEHNCSRRQRDWYFVQVWHSKWQGLFPERYWGALDAARIRLQPWRCDCSDVEGELWGGRPGHRKIPDMSKLRATIFLGSLWWGLHHLCRPQWWHAATKGGASDLPLPALMLPTRLDSGAPSGFPCTIIPHTNTGKHNAKETSEKDKPILPRTAAEWKSEAFDLVPWHGSF